VEEWSMAGELVEEIDNSPAYDSCLVNLSPDRI